MPEDDAELVSEPVGVGVGVADGVVESDTVVLGVSVPVGVSLPVCDADRVVLGVGELDAVAPADLVVEPVGVFDGELEFDGDGAGVFDGVGPAHAIEPGCENVPGAHKLQPLRRYDVYVLAGHSCGTAVPRGQPGPSGHCTGSAGPFSASGAEKVPSGQHVAPSVSLKSVMVR